MNKNIKYIVGALVTLTWIGIAIWLGIQGSKNDDKDIKIAVLEEKIQDQKMEISTSKDLAEYERKKNIDSQTKINKESDEASKCQKNEVEFIKTYERLKEEIRLLKLSQKD